jgi:hypothetical protein
MNLLESLTDDTWHDIDEFSVSSHVDKEELEKMVGFFTGYGFIELDAGGERFRVDKGYLKLDS